MPERGRGKKATGEEKKKWGRKITLSSLTVSGNLFDFFPAHGLQHNLVIS